MVYMFIDLFAYRNLSEMGLSNKLAHSARMWQSGRTWRQKFARLNLRAVLYASWALGLFPFVYVSGRQKLRRSTWLLGYGILLNSGFICCTVAYHRAMEGPLLLEIFRRNPLAKHISFLNDLQLMATILVTLGRNWWMSKELEHLLNALLRLYRKYLQQYESDSPDCPKFGNYVIYKSMSIWLELLSMLFIQFGLATPVSYRLLLGVISLVVNQTSVLLLGMHFHLAVLLVYRSLWLVNRELLQLARQLRLQQVEASTRMGELHWIYGRLVELGARLTNLYDFQMILFMLCLLSVNILSTFYIIVFTVSLGRSLTFLLVLNFIQVMAINIADTWLNIAVGELAERAGQGTLTILKLYNDIGRTDIELERNISLFTLFCRHRKLKFRHCGLFHVNNAMGFRMMVTCVLYILYLVQFDFMNL